MGGGGGGVDMDVTTLFDCHVEYETEGDVEGAVQQNFLFSYPFCKCLHVPSVFHARLLSTSF